jgi:ABC-type multidrug transport system fused ATPase/permease subunit
MEKNYEITEKQLAFLDGFLLKRYPNISDDTRIELTDHLISDFEATSKNGNLSQYLSNETEFVRKFVSRKVKLLRVNYDSDVWQEYFSFFTSIKKIPITLFCFFCIYFLSQNLNDKLTWISCFFSVFIVYGYSLIAQTNNFPKKIRKLPEVQLLGKGITMGIPYLMCIVTFFFEAKIFLLKSRIFFSFYWFFAFSLSIAAIIILNKKKNIIFYKYKHLLN